MNKKLKTSLLTILLATLFAGGLLIGAALAQEKSSLLIPPTNSRTVYLLFMKMTGKPFNAESVIRGSEAFRAAPGDEQSRMISTMKPALETEFASLDKDSQVLVIRSGVYMRNVTSPYIGLEAKFVQQTKSADSIYFPYTYGGINIALIPDKLEPFLNIPMKAAEANAAALKIISGAATIVIEMIPLSADPRSAMRLDGIDQWLLMTKIVAVSYYNQNMQTIWKWQDPNYRRAGTPSPLQQLKR
ncbi:MAG: hypothetical protein DI586_10820 [Micavibrio aeruginosavorus]|uniref:Uncharacterized protein n=1 Tax=Micavibrio aeruginosavorus TaxID=349221 RepID=A0A2W5FC05_9BACT|nr:MAG: hypothetical protein DI586_10820 [Micavibrio aeruginosavorus]